METTIDKITFEGETYYFNKGIVYDENFLEIPKSISQKVLACYFANINRDNLSEEALLEHIKHLKVAELYNECLEVINYGLNKYSTSTYFYKSAFPMITSCYRALNQAQKAIDFWMENKSIFSSCLSVPLLTSLAAAYCDVGNYELAKKCANKAYALQGGSLNYRTELSLVYKRIAKETKQQ